jgi:hypothetical protein
MFGLAAIDLRTRVCNSIRVEGAFDMLRYKPFTYFKYEQLPEMGDLDRGRCRTACCIAGHIVYAALGAKELAKLRDYEIADVAKRIWQKAYGWEEARRLQFTDTGWGCHLQKVTPDEAIAHLCGAPAICRDYGSA